MGSFFTNLQVHTGASPPTEVRDQLLDALQQLAAPVDTPPRGMYVAPAGKEPWIGLYDELTEDQDSMDLDLLAEFISAKLDKPVVWILNHDSSVLRLGLYRGGILCDAVRAGRDRDSVAVGSAELWNDLLAPGRLVDQLQELMARPELSADDRLAGIASALGLHPGKCRIGFNDLQNGYVLDMTGFSLLTVGSPQAIVQTEPESPSPAFELARWSADNPVCEFVRGDSFGERCRFPFRSVGGSTTGILVHVWGTALTAKVAQIVGIACFNPLDPQNYVEGQLREAPDGHMLTARFEDLPVAPASEEALRVRFKDGRISLPSFRVSEVSRSMGAIAQTTLIIELRGMAVSTGGGELNVAAAPLANLDGGRAVWKATLEVRSK